MMICSTEEIERALTHYQGLVFDMDGTLIDTMPAHLDAWEKTAANFGIPFERDWIHRLGGMPSAKIVGHINREFDMALDPQQVAEFKIATFAAMKEQGDRIEVTCQIVLDHFGKKPMAIGTGSLRPTAMSLLERTQLFNYFDAVVSASEVENHKPHPETFLKAAELMGLEPTMCVVFEDTQLGLQAAHAAGMDCFMVVGEQLEFHPVPNI